MKNIVFVDWHNTLCHQPFWASALSDESHELHSQANTAVAALFGQTHRKETLAWMRGQRSSEQMLELALDGVEYTDLLAALAEDCKNMKPQTTLLEGLLALPEDVQVALATDNMDAFESQVPHIEHVNNWPLLCSSALGVLKADSVTKFFGGHIASMNLNFSDCVLIDDSPANIKAFSKIGGHGIRYRSDEQALSDLNEWLAR